MLLVLLISSKIGSVCLQAASQNNVRHLPWMYFYGSLQHSARAFWTLNNVPKDIRMHKYVSLLMT